MDVETERGCVGNDVCGECVGGWMCECVGHMRCNCGGTDLHHAGDAIRTPHEGGIRRTPVNMMHSRTTTATPHMPHTHTHSHTTHTHSHNTPHPHISRCNHSQSPLITTPEAPRTPQHAKPEPQPQPSQVVHMCVVLTEGRAGMQTRMPAAQHCSLLLHRCQGGRGRVEC